MGQCVCSNLLLFARVPPDQQSIFTAADEQPRVEVVVPLFESLSASNREHFSETGRFTGSLQTRQSQVVSADRILHVQQSQFRRWRCGRSAERRSTCLARRCVRLYFSDSERPASTQTASILRTLWPIHLYCFRPSSFGRRAWRLSRTTACSSLFGKSGRRRRRKETGKKKRTKCNNTGETKTTWKKLEWCA